MPTTIDALDAAYKAAVTGYYEAMKRTGSAAEAKQIEDAFYAVERAYHEALIGALEADNDQIEALQTSISDQAKTVETEMKNAQKPAKLLKEFNKLGTLAMNLVEKAKKPDDKSDDKQAGKKKTENA